MSCSVIDHIMECANYFFEIVMLVVAKAFSIHYNGGEISVLGNNNNKPWYPVKLITTTLKVR